MRILVDNVLDQGTIAASNESANYPPENLYHDFLKARLQCTAETENLITIDFATGQTINCLFFAYHNLNYMNVRLYRGANLLEEVQFGAGDLIYTEDREDSMIFIGAEELDEYFIDGIEVQTDAVYFSETYEGVTQVIITIHGEEQSYLGGLALGEYFQALDPVAVFPEGQIDNSITTRSPYGQSLQTYIEPYSTALYAFRGNRDDWNDMRDLYLGIGVGAHVWVDFHERNHAFKSPQYCTLDSFSESAKTALRYEWNVRFTEAR